MKNTGAIILVLILVIGVYYLSPETATVPVQQQAESSTTTTTAPDSTNNTTTNPSTNTTTHTGTTTPTPTEIEGSYENSLKGEIYAWKLVNDKWCPIYTDYVAESMYDSTTGSQIDDFGVNASLTLKSVLSGADYEYYFTQKLSLSDVEIIYYTSIAQVFKLPVSNIDLTYETHHMFGEHSAVLDNYGILRISHIFDENAVELRSALYNYIVDTTDQTPLIFGIEGKVVYSYSVSIKYNDDVVQSYNGHVDYNIGFSTQQAVPTGNPNHKITHTVCSTYFMPDMPSTKMVVLPIMFIILSLFIVYGYKNSVTNNKKR